MILRALYDYYQRKALDPDPARRLPAFGLEEKEIPFVIELAADGRPLLISDTRSGEGKKKVARRYLVPQGVKKSANIAANLFWGTAEYALGVVCRDNPVRVSGQHADFRKRIAELPESCKQDAGLLALKAFFVDHGLAALTDDPLWQEIFETNPLLTFRLAGDNNLICQRPDIVSAMPREILKAGRNAVCLVTGHAATAERLHTVIKGIWRAQSSGANIVSFDKDAFTSFNKTQGDNAPVSPAAAFAYTTALNHLLERGSRQFIQVGDAATVFWAQKNDPVEDDFAAIFGDQDDPDAHTDQVRSFLNAVDSGVFGGGRGENRFYVLGLAPNAARIAIRFWHAEPLSIVARHVRQWFSDLEIVKADSEPPYPAIKRLLASICLPTKERPFGDLDKLPEIVVGDVMRSALLGGEIPSQILNSAIQRCRADQARKDSVSGKPVRHVSHSRAALIKAALNRHFRIHSPDQKEITVSLDPSNTDGPYLRGRLFALFERMQELAAERELNRTIRDSFFGSAMSTPRAVFPRLIRLNQQHLRDLKRSNPSAANYLDRELRSVNDKLDPESAFPAASKLQDQGVFALGYYHQRQAFFTKFESSESTEGKSK
ncbi:MAG: type I-C CRISPR-associated protein Cas8c/Csd1 [Azonexus sp.]|nr:type I-C CRISPR-associated protein Cas8c/Csd1 [Azonexus sp.]MDP3637762.1 type I-C CRISPR-associated protein Cas8c/Csd1 [Azonexus sp.]MDZ4316385.1 type I-C CRISPR-associated protein Cas8c/Csd1 [Azonexus sp.]